MNSIKWVLAAVALSVAATPATARKKPPLTPLAIQAIQLKEFESTPRILFRSVVSVFQDLGYTIDQADFDSGLITASSASKNKTNFWNALGGVAASGNTRATATVEELANGRSSVRLNFVSSKSSSSWYGQSSKNDKPILDPKVYQAAFEKIEEALFVRQATNAPVPPVAAAPVSTPPAATSPAPVTGLVSTPPAATSSAPVVVPAKAGSAAAASAPSTPAAGTIATPAPKAEPSASPK